MKIIINNLTDLDQLYAIHSVINKFKEKDSSDSVGIDCVDTRTFITHPIGTQNKSLITIQKTIIDENKRLVKKLQIMEGKK